MEFMGKLAQSVFSLVAALIPTRLYILVRFVLAPHGFWQNLILLGAGFWILGAAQTTLLFAWTVALYLIWSE